MPTDSRHTRLLGAAVAAGGVTAVILFWRRRKRLEKALRFPWQSNPLKGADTQFYLLKNAMDARVAEGGVGGASAIVFHHGSCIFEHCVGDLQHDSIVRVMSMSKIATSICALRLVEEDLLNLDEDLTKKWIPELAGAKVLCSSDCSSVEPRKGGITLRQLLTHTSGLSYPFHTKSSVGDDYDEPGVPVSRIIEEMHKRYKEQGLFSGIPFLDEHTSEDFMRRLSLCPLAFQPGTRFLYSLGVDVAGIVVERVKEAPLSRVMQAYLFGPLGMTDTGFHVPADKFARLANLYTPSVYGCRSIVVVGEGVQRSHPEEKTNFEYDKEKPWVCQDLMCSGGAGLVSTLTDYARLLHALIAVVSRTPIAGCPPVLACSLANLIAHDALESLPRVGELKIGEGHSLGCAVYTEPQEIVPAGVMRWGGIFGTKWLADPKREIVAVLFTQRFPNEDGDVREQFEDLVYQALL